jgi:hypothetical protein
MGKDEITTHGTAAVAAAEPDAPVYWNHLKTFVLILVY